MMTLYICSFNYPYYQGIFFIYFAFDTIIYQIFQQKPKLKEGVYKGIIKKFLFYEHDRYSP